MPSCITWCATSSARWSTSAAARSRRTGWRKCWQARDRDAGGADLHAGRPVPGENRLRSQVGAAAGSARSPRAWSAWFLITECLCHAPYPNQDLRPDPRRRRATRPWPPAPTRSASCSIRTARATSRRQQAAALIAPVPPFVTAVGAVRQRRRRKQVRGGSGGGAGGAAAVPWRRNAGAVRGDRRSGVRRPFVRAFRVRPDTQPPDLLEYEQQLSRRQSLVLPACCSIPRWTPTAAAERFSIGLSFQKNSRLGSF